jgi:hypothetical protein
MRRVVLLLGAVVLLFLSPRATAMGRPLIVTTQDHSLADASDCDHFHTQISTSLPSRAHATEERNLQLSEVDGLKIRASEQGGVSIHGWDRPYAHLTVCKFAEGLTEKDAALELSDVAIGFHSGELFTRGPASAMNRVWWVHMILQLPRSANVNVIAANGGISIRNMSGKVVAHARNGGISLASCGGDNKLSTENGGIAVENVSGKVEAVTDKGTISLKLHPGEQTSPDVEARTSEAGDIVCRTACEGGSASWNADRTYLRLGNSSLTPAIRLMTTGAPIIIDQVR